eukprot:CAMPEP_0180651344 /NCGR_PEP_ID=MMETSP1037_2-20121125/52811_1 /TAXON_ID=632150 /ORGANISM="Azadinium spinosum, Strain 3D9" /LENGTH=69 /DNA_ID=CAMNT_0022676939 /DNA_START=162 /DNA_END=371 /DNA_ORIENTATION=-
MAMLQPKRGRSTSGSATFPGLGSGPSSQRRQVDEELSDATASAAAVGEAAEGTEGVSSVHLGEGAKTEW